MTAIIDIDKMMTQFRLASRELFNNFFRVADPYDNDGWLFEGRFSEVQAVLFQKLVTEPASLPNVRYGSLQTGIVVKLRNSEMVPIMLNRELKSGYWDYPLKEVTKEAELSFVSFFDWDQLDCRDNRYVLVQVQRWPSHPETIGKQALIESHYVRFATTGEP